MANPTNLDIVMDREKWRVLITKLVEESSSMSNEKPPHQCAMQIDILEIMQPDILGMKLIAVWITFVETDGRGNNTYPSDEILANAIKNMSRASPRDAKKKPPFVTRKWKKKEHWDDIEIRPKQTQIEIDEHKQIGQKWQRRISKDEGNTGGRKRSKAQTTSRYAQRRRLIVSPAERNECVKLELQEAWEPPCKRSPLAW